MAEAYDYMKDIGPADAPGSFAAAYLKLRGAALDWAQAHGAGELAEIAASAPDVMYTVTMLLRDGRVPKKAKAGLCAAAVYFVLPIDALPLGWLDDVYIALIALTGVMDAVGEDVLAEYWPGEAGGVLKLKGMLDTLNERFGAGAVRRLAKRLLGE